MQVQITISFFGYLLVFVGCFLLNRLVTTKLGKRVSRGNSQQFLKNQSEKLNIPQTICSFITVVLWIYKTYVYKVSHTIQLIDMFCAVVFLADKFLRLYNRDFAPVELLNWESILDALT